MGFVQAQELAEKAVGEAPQPWWGNGSAHLRYENAGGQNQGQFSALVPLLGDLGESGTLSGSLYFMEPYAHWVEGDAYQAGLGLGVRHLFGRQTLDALRTVPQAMPGWLDEGIFVGFNAFLNNANTAADEGLWQAAFTLETGTRWLELRGRYHLPLDDGERTTERFVNRVQDQYSVNSVTVTQTSIIDQTFRWLTESLEGWQADATLLVPGLDRWVDLRLIGGYVHFNGLGHYGMEAGSWRMGADFRPVPAVVLSAMWFEEERLLGDEWLFGVGIEIPFETRNLGDGRGGFWQQVKRAFQPRRRHLAERMIEPARRHSLPVQVTTRLENLTTRITDTFSAILPDGQVVRVERQYNHNYHGNSAAGSSRSSYQSASFGASGTTILNSSGFVAASSVTTTLGNVAGVDPQTVIPVTLNNDNPGLAIGGVQVFDPGIISGTGSAVINLSSIQIPSNTSGGSTQDQTQP